jgi:hypothetical protein
MLTERPEGGWRFTYLPGYTGPPVSLTLPCREEPYDFPGFPAVFEGLLPEERSWKPCCVTKIDRRAFRQLVRGGRSGGLSDRRRRSIVLLDPLQSLMPYCPITLEPIAEANSPAPGCGPCIRG